MNPQYLKGSSDTDEVFKADLRIDVTEFFAPGADSFTDQRDHTRVRDKAECV